MRLLAIAAALVLSAACGDNDDPPVNGDGGGTDANTNIDAGTDATPMVTFTSFVIQQVMNPSATGDAIPFAMFEALPDPDKDNPNAYEALFP